MTTTPLPLVRHRQTGAVLLIGMIMLLMVTVAAIAVARLSMRHTQVVHNEQARTEALSAANYALDTVVNQSFDAGQWSRFSGDDGATVDVPLSAFDAGDASNAAGRVAVRISRLSQKRCRKVQNRELFEADGSISEAHRSCVRSNGNSNLSIGSAAGGDPSACSNMLWDMQAEIDTTSRSALLDANVPVVQGVEQMTAENCS